MNKQELTTFEKKKLIKFINGRAINVEDLSSYRNHGHPSQNFARFAEPDDEEWDLDEEYAAQGIEAIDCIEHDGLWEWTQIEDSKQEQAIAFIKKETGCF